MSMDRAFTFPPRELRTTWGAVPHTVSTAVVTKDAFLKEIVVTNTTAGALTLTITDNDSSPVTFMALAIPAGEHVIFQYDAGVKLVKGVKWQASGAGLNASLAGFTN